MPVGHRVRIARRFLRSIRIDSDFGEAASLEGFVCPQSFSDVLLTMTRHVSETGQGAFTWTGPYGSGKSSLVVALSALLNGNAGLQTEAAKVFGRKVTRSIHEALPTGTKGWRVLPVVARRDDPVVVIGEAVKRMGLVARQPRGGWTETNLIATLTGAAAEKPKTHGGLVLFIDEMGKFLEAAAQDGSDIYVLQQLAEAASRSNGRFLLVGVLHQAFEEYAHRLSHEMRDEWAKIQGPFPRSHRQHRGRGTDRPHLPRDRERSSSEEARCARFGRRSVFASRSSPRRRETGYHARSMLATSPGRCLPIGTNIPPAISGKTSVVFLASSTPPSRTVFRISLTKPPPMNCTARTNFGTTCVSTLSHPSLLLQTGTGGLWRPKRWNGAKLSVAMPFMCKPTQDNCGYRPVQGALGPHSPILSFCAVCFPGDLRQRTRDETHAVGHLVVHNFQEIPSMLARYLLVVTLTST